MGGGFGDGEQGGEERSGEAAGDGGERWGERGGEGGDHAKEHGRSREREREEVRGEAGEGELSQGQGDRGKRGGLGAEGEASGGSHRAGQPSGKRSRDRWPEPQNTGGGGDRELKAEHDGEGWVGEQQEHYGEAEGTTPPRASAGGHPGEHEDGHDTGPQDARLPAGQQRERGGQQDAGGGEQRTAGTEGDHEPEARRQQHRQVLAAGGEQMREARRFERVIEVTAQKRGVAERHPDEQAGVFGRQAGQGTATRGGTNRLARL